MRSVKSLNKLGVVEVVSAIERGDIKPIDVVQACLDQISERNTEVKAFVSWDPDRAKQDAESLQRVTEGGLYGVPFAVKDIISTAYYPTQYGSDIYRDAKPQVDAVSVGLAKHQGAILLGKVATGEFATQTPSSARNPLRPTHTPGGSSSGSAAAVADYMVPVAFGTQTTGSIVRPAVYCGVVGYKPSFGLIPSAGMKALSPSQDTIGVITRDVSDAALFVLGTQGSKSVARYAGKPRIMMCLSTQWDYMQPYAVEALRRLAQQLESAGCVVSQQWLPAELEAAIEIQPRLFMYEARQSLLRERVEHGGALSARLSARLAAGDDISFDEYTSMRCQVARAQEHVRMLFNDVDAILYPAAAGEADPGLASAGDPRFGALWTMLHLPCISFPIDLGPTGLPVGAQLVGEFFHDTRLLAIAKHVEDSLRRHGPIVTG